MADIAPPERRGQALSWFSVTAYLGQGIGPAIGESIASAAGRPWAFSAAGMLCLAGAAGFLLGKAVILPGDFSRREALILNGRLAMRMIGAVVVLLLIAGSIEGFVSSSLAPAPVRLGTSVASALFLILYLWRGAHHSAAT